MVKTTTIVMYPSPGIGHIISMVELAKLLSHRHQEQHFSITILITTGLLDHPSIDSYINRISSSHPSITFHSFPSITVTHSSTQSLAATAFQFIKENVVNVESKLRQITQTSVIKVFIIDMFCTSAMEIASTMEIFAVEQREGDGFVSGEEVEKRVRELMESERGTEIRERSLKFKDMARDAFGEFGSSTKALANLVQTWNEITH